MDRIQIVAVVIAIVWMLAVYILTVMGLLDQSAQIFLDSIMLIALSVLMTWRSKRKK